MLKAGFASEWSICSRQSYSRVPWPAGAQIEVIWAPADCPASGAADRLKSSGTLMKDRALLCHVRQRQRAGCAQPVATVNIYGTKHIMS